MATEAPDNVQAIFSKLESRESILSSCTSLYKTLNSHFSSLEHSIASESQTLDTKLLTLDSDFHNSLEKLHLRQQSIPARLSPFSSRIETLTQLALAETKKPPPVDDEIKSLCMMMDAQGLLEMISSKGKEVAGVKSSLQSGFAECVDPVRLVLDSVDVFLKLNKNVKACCMVVGVLFPPEKLKERKDDVGVLFPRSVLERANKMALEWKEKALERLASGLVKAKHGMYGMGPSVVLMFLQFVAGFGLKDTFEFEYLKNMMLDFQLRKDWKEMAKFSLPLFGEKVEDIVNELLESKKDLDAVYFIKEGNLTEKFNPASIIKCYLSRAEKEAEYALRKGNNSSEATDEASVIETIAFKFIIKCVEDNKLEDEFPLTITRKRLCNLERIKNEKKAEKKAAALGDGGRPSSHKRGRSSSGPPLSHPVKSPRFSGSYQQPYRQRNPVSPAHQNPVSMYPAPHNNYPSQSAYDTAPPYGSTTYGGSHLPSPAQAVSQPPPYAHGENLNVGAPAPRVGGSYGGSYSLYDYAQNTYPPPYTQ